MTVLLTEDKGNKISHTMFTSSVSLTMSRRQWDSVLGSLNYVVEVLLLHKFTPPSPMQPWKQKFPVNERGTNKWKLLASFIANFNTGTGMATYTVPNPGVTPNQTFFVSTDAGLGCGFQSSEGWLLWSDPQHPMHMQCKQAHTSLAVPTMEFRNMGLGDMLLSP